MGYKMKGFTYPGKSPLKQDYGLSSETSVGSGTSKDKKEERTYTEADLAAYKEYYKNLYGDSKKDPTLEDKYTKEGVSKKEGLPEGTEEYLKSKGERYNIWKDPNLRKKITDPKAAKELKAAKATEGLVGDEMATSKAEIKQRKTKSKTDQTLSRADRKIQKLKDKEKLARATGKLSVTVDPLTGFKVTPQADKLAKRIKKKEARIAAKKTRKDTKKIKTDAKTKTK